MPEAAAWGIEPGFHDTSGAWRETPSRTATELLRAMGAEDDEPPSVPELWVIRADEGLHLGGRWELHTEDGDIRRVAGSVPDPPLGYHRLISEHDGRAVQLVVSPGVCQWPGRQRMWGWATQLYALRSSASWGIGDLGDLRRLAEWSAGVGAGMVLLNPLHAPVPVAPVQPSPYFPSSRCFRNPLYLRVEDVPGTAGLGEPLDQAATAGRALLESRTIDRDTIWRLKLSVLELAWQAFPGHEAFDAFVAAGGRQLARFATHTALAERFGATWHRWPASYRHPDSEAVAEFATEEADRIRFHQWLQWLIDRQLESASAAVDLVQDIAIGVDPGGADAWMWQDVLAADVSVGAPPDEYNTQGQDWGLPPFDPWKLRAAHFEPFIAVLRAAFRHAGGLRFDHVMGLFRLFWIPAGRSPADGAYVRYPSPELLDILALESHRAGAYVVGEDLGTVEDQVRTELHDRKILSYRLLWFEPGPPREFPPHSLGAVTTHDLPTIAGLWSGADLAAQRARGMVPNEASTTALRDRLREWTGAADDAPVSEVVHRTYELLAEAPSAIVTATFDDALGVEERPNYPGTTGGTNWSLALPVLLDDIEQDGRVGQIASTLTDRGSGTE